MGAPRNSLKFCYFAILLLPAWLRALARCNAAGRLLAGVPGPGLPRGARRASCVAQLHPWLLWLWRQWHNGAHSDCKMSSGVKQTAKYQLRQLQSTCCESHMNFETIETVICGVHQNLFVRHLL